ncbi:MAG: hypothetical protein KA712_22700 [Myxococcales bacterium]|nr:hypothetical protein [Myxococcales bacterium]
MSKRPEHHVPSYLLERLAQGELPPAQAAALRAKLAAQPGGAEEALLHLRDDDVAILAAHPPVEAAREIRRRLAQNPAAARPRPFLLPALALGVAGAAALVALTPAAETRRGQNTLSVQEEYVGIKGLAPHLIVYRKHEGAPQRLTAQDTVSPGDVLQLAYVVPGDPKGGPPPYGAIVSVDALKTTTLHFPTRPGAAAVMTTQGETRLPISYELDASPGFERFVLLLSAEPFATEPLLRTLRQGGALPRGLVRFEMTLNKELP